MFTVFWTIQVICLDDRVPNTAISQMTAPGIHTAAVLTKPILSFSLAIFKNGQPRKTVFSVTKKRISGKRL